MDPAALDAAWADLAARWDDEAAHRAFIDRFGDLEALAEVVVALSTLASLPDIVEAEINPVIVHSHGCTAVDAVVRKVVL